jgi:protease-4
MVTAWMRDTYDQFTQRVMSHRKGKIKDIDQVARGRIFIAKEARYLGMVDELGGIDDAVNFAAAQVGLKPGSYDVKSVPPTRTLGDLLTGNVDDAEAVMHFKPQMKVEVSGDSLLRLVSPGTRQMLVQQLQFIQMLEERPVLLISPYVVSVK